MYYPVIDPAQCVECGLCSRVCPGVQMEFAPAESIEKSMEGNALACFNAWSTDSQKRHCSASGGVLSTLIPALLEQGRYDCVFCLNSYDYREQLHARHHMATDFSGDWASNKSPKSRYLPVSHEEAVAYMRAHPTERLILIGTSCAIRGLTKAIRQLYRDREQYLLIGLFCDKVFSYHIMDYYQQERFCNGKELSELHFKNKESGGWPGDLKFRFSDGSTCYHDKSNRAGMKEYFMPERCLYCIDKLNIQADISVGDNYTGIDESPLGSNSVIIRTERGLAAWQSVCDQIETRSISLENISKAQALSWRANNAQYAMVKQKKVAEKTGEALTLIPGISVEENRHVTANYTNMLARLHSGKVFPEHPEELEKQIRKANRVPLRRKVRGFLSKCCHFLKKI